ncbi:short chain fatty acid transporter (plasmid) [Deinococcus proteolyticus MRP]|uniref:Short chain fatty acid transporter n=1 Tax=Deinococcus proteolyticus (strain ATCC 35074 / DSM 20540 / JCM 6276 / NBRC 101906 / NCIMB 13154 / VKM Ac-1939 / CCM 2703 / MRP) TaxID=693977 RepID=F0RPN2_DEIPM|nr:MULTISPECIES: short-chain fatty acid transporter [Deinococcus]ADY27338.1 short chain fatty acid transporter [Deinococcus proteolyticus MRP]MCY1704210.1 short-chain fatty acid transporter [Deinococcus sp. SL84]
MFRALANASNALVTRLLPDPFIFVALLTLLVLALGVLLTPHTLPQMVQFWGDGFWELLAFTMQMALVLVTGHALASTPFFRRLLGGLAGLAKTAPAAIVLVTAVSLVANWINWGFGLVIGAIFARELARRVPGVDYRLLIASAYSGFVIWHAGFSGSIPLTIATPDHFLEGQIGLIPTSQTIFAPFNLILVGVLALLIPLVNRAMLDREHPVVVDPALLAEKAPAAAWAPADQTPAQRLENSPVLSLLLGGLGLAFLAMYFAAEGFKLNLNIVNFAFLFLAILLHGTPARFIAATTEAVQGAAGILIQFPFYAGLAGMMAGSGLIERVSDAFVAMSTPQTFPVLAFWSAGLVNIFVPSGGGQWAVQGPVMVQAAQSLGASLPKTAMAVAWGDAWTNMIQPFWALPALAIAGLHARDIMGYCLVILLLVGAVVSLGLYLLPG